MNAIQFIINEHRRFKRRFASIGKRSRNETAKTRMFKNLCAELVRHETMEEKVWYPNFKNDPKIKPVVKYLVHEEKTAAKKIKTFKKVRFNINWEKEFPKFKKAVLSHASHEEKKLFPKVRKILDNKELSAIGIKLRKFKARHKIK